MKLILAFTIIALNTTSLLAQDKKAARQPVQKSTKQVKHKPDSATKAKRSTEPDTAQAKPESQNMEMPRNRRLKHHTDLINVPEK